MISSTSPSWSWKIRSRGMPMPSARRACRCRCRLSPWTGMKKLGMDQRQQQLHLLLAGVAGDVNMGDGRVNHLDPSLDQLVDHPPDFLLIAGDGRGGEDHGVIATEDDVAVAARGHARQRRFGLTLAAGDHQRHLLRRQFFGGFHDAHARLWALSDSPAAGRSRNSAASSVRQWRPCDCSGARCR